MILIYIDVFAHLRKEIYKLGEPIMHRVTGKLLKNLETVKR